MIPLAHPRWNARPRRMRVSPQVVSGAANQKRVGSSVPEPAQPLQKTRKMAKVERPPEPAEPPKAAGKAKVERPPAKAPPAKAPPVKAPPAKAPPVKVPSAPELAHPKKKAKAAVKAVVDATSRAKSAPLTAARSKAVKASSSEAKAKAPPPTVHADVPPPFLSSLKPWTSQRWRFQR